MGGIPSQSQLLDRQKKAQDRLLQLKDSYENFLTFWQQFQKEEKSLTKELHKHLDAEKLRSVLKHIDKNN